MFFRLKTICFILIVAIVVFPLKAQAKGLSVVKTEAHAQGRTAEICLAFDRELKIQGRELLLSYLFLKQGKKTMRIKYEEVSLAPKRLCVQGLKHRKTYELTFKKMKHGLSKTYKGVFEIPDRSKKLQFVGAQLRDLLPRHSNASPRAMMAGRAHILSSINVPQVHLSLYHFPNSKDYVAAWRHFKGNNVSPSESRLFANEYGKLVFESDLHFDDTPNKKQTLIAPLPQKQNLKGGLYYLAAMPQNEEGAHPALFTGQWFLVSDLYMNSVLTKSGVQVFTFSKKTKSSLPFTKVNLWGAAGKQIAEGITDKDGHIFLPLKEKTANQVSFVSAQGQAGAEIIPVKKQRITHKNLVSVRSVLQTDKDGYGVGETVHISMLAQNVKGMPLRFEKSAMHFLSPDGSLYKKLNVKQTEDGGALIEVSAPVTKDPGAWSLEWHQENGTLLSRKQITIAQDREVASIKVRQKKGARNYIDIFVYDKKGKALLYKNGWVDVRCQRPSFKKWHHFDFGTKALEECHSKKRVPFVTNAKGYATLNIDADPRWGKKVIAHVHGSLEKGSVVLPVKRFTEHVGIRLLTPNDVFAENSYAGIEVRAVGIEDEEEYFYTVYEEGRQFQWYTDEKQWLYKRLPEHRRVGGGYIKLRPNKAQVIEWPVTTGSYLIEITDGWGQVHARKSFEAGRSVQEIEKDIVSKRVVKKDAGIFSVHVAKASMVHAFVSDGKMTYSTARHMKPGSNNFSIPFDQFQNDNLTAYITQTPDDGNASIQKIEQISFQKAPLLPHSKNNDVAFTIPSHLFLAKGDQVSFEVKFYSQKAGVFTTVIDSSPQVQLLKSVPETVRFKKAGQKGFTVTLVVNDQPTDPLRIKLRDKSQILAEAKLNINLINRKSFHWSVDVSRVEKDLVYTYSDDNRRFTIGSVVPIPAFLSKLESLMCYVPQTTVEQVSWLRVVSAWRPMLMAMGLLTHESYGAYREKILYQLLSKQKMNGSFLAHDQGQAGDLVATASALVALSTFGDGQYSFEEARAETWVKEKLKTAWFDESQRSDRAIAFSMLARIGRVDAAALRYFSQKSLDEPISLIGKLALVRAFESINEPQEATIWFDKIPYNKLSQNLPALALLAPYEGISFNDAVMNWAKSKTHLIPYLDMLSSLVQDAGTWRIEQDGDKQKYFGIMPLRETGASIVNKAKKPLYVGSVKRKQVKKKAFHGSIDRSLYHMDGSPVHKKETILTGTTYIMRLSGKAGRPMKLVLPVSSAFSYESIGENEEGYATHVFAWLAQERRTPAGVRKVGRSLTINVPDSKEWHAVVLFKPLITGHYEVPEAMALLNCDEHLIKQGILRVKAR